MFTLEQHIDDLVAHIRKVQDAGILLGKRLIEAGHRDTGKALIGNVMVHDASKFTGIEWDYLHTGPDTPEEELALAIKQHNTTNEHHPEHWGGIEKMPDEHLAETICDWVARSQEFGTSVHDFIKDTAMDRFKIDPETKERIDFFLSLLLRNSFARKVKTA